MTLFYEIKFYDYWHLSSGLSAGAKLDSTVVKDENTLPYAPGKTIKGFVREMAELLDDKELVNVCFGLEGTDMGKAYFSNATMKQETAEEIIQHSLQENLYDVIASTKIGENGIAQGNTLREIEVVVPLALQGKITDIPQEHIEKITKALKMIKRMGLNRNRGLGRCEFIIREEQK
jgi:hypothetical protein